MRAARHGMAARAQHHRKSFAMICRGQGRPTKQVSRAGWLWPAWWLPCALSWLIVVLPAAALLAQPAPTRFEGEVRVVWGGPVSRTFEGRVTISDGGQLRLVRNLGLEPDSIGKIRNEHPGSLQLLASQPSRFGGMDVAIQAPQAAQLTFQFRDPLSRQWVEHRVSVGEILQGNWLQSLDERGTRLGVERQVHDRLRVRMSDQNQILLTGTRWTGTLAGVATGLTPGRYLLRGALVGSGTEPQSILEQEVVVDASGDFSTLPLDVPVPDAEGVYRLELSLHPRRFLGSILSAPPALTRRVEFVAFDPAASQTLIAGWEPVFSINAWKASQPGMLAWLSPLGASNLVATSRWQPLADNLRQPIRHGSLGSRDLVLKEAPNADGAERCLTLTDEAWLAIPLMGLRPDWPHRLRIRTPRDQPLQLTASLQQLATDAHPANMPSDHRLSITRRQCSQDGSLAEFEVVFWSSGDTEYLILSNAQPHPMSSVVDVVVDQAQMEPMNDLALDQGSMQFSERRRAGIYFDKPQLADFVGAHRVRDPVTGRALESWQTWQLACERLTQYVQCCGANLVVMKVHADGGAVFPSQQLHPTARYDGGVFFSDGRSPSVKDAVQLLLQHCERRGLQLILALELDAPLPELEHRPERSATRGLHQVRLSGDEVTAGAGVTRVAYNPLNEHVQSAVAGVCRELVNRYGQSPALAGIQLQLDDSSPLVFRGDRWGYDQQTLAAFERFTQTQLPVGDQLTDALRGPLRLAFLNWRAEQMTAFLKRLGDIVQASHPQRRLYLNATRLWDQIPNSEHFHNASAILRNPAEYLVARGIDAARLGEHPQVVLMQGQFQRAEPGNLANEWILHLAQRRGLTGTATGQAAAIVVQQPRVQQLQEFIKFSEATQRDGGQTVVYPIDASSAVQARRSIVEQLYDGDLQLFSQGAWLTSANQASALKQLRRSFLELPPVLLRDFPTATERTSVRVRSGKHDEQWFVQIVNNSPWRESIRLQVQLSAAGVPVRILGDQSVSLQRTSATAGTPRVENWELSVEPFDLVALRIPDPNARLVDVIHHSPDEVLPRIAAELGQLESLLLRAADPTQQQTLPDILGDFEQWTTAGVPVGWDVSSLPRVRITRSDDLPHSGRSSLMIENENTGDVSAWIQSRPIRPPSSGRLAVEVWLRSPSVGSAAVVRISVMGRLRSGARFERTHQVGSARQSAIANDWGTRPATLYVSDIPTDQLDELFIAVELIGSGRVWVDDIQLLEPWLDPDERVYLQGMMLVAKQKLADNNPFPAEQLLDSHWGRYLADIAARTSLPANPSRIPAASASVPETESGWGRGDGVFHQLREAVRERWRK